MRRSAAKPSKWAAVARQISARSTSQYDAASLPASLVATWSRSPTCLSSVRALRATTSRSARCSGRSPGPPRSRSVGPRISASGVRSSWLTLAKSCVSSSLARATAASSSRCAAASCCPRSCETPAARARAAARGISAGSSAAARSPAVAAAARSRSAASGAGNQGAQASSRCDAARSVSSVPARSGARGGPSPRSLPAIAASVAPSARHESAITPWASACASAGPAKGGGAARSGPSSTGQRQRSSSMAYPDGMTCARR